MTKDIDEKLYMDLLDLCEKYSDELQLFESVPAPRDVCRMDWTNLASCSSYAGNNAHDEFVAGLCARMLSSVGTNLNMDRYVKKPLSPALLGIVESRQEQLRSIFPR